MAIERGRRTPTFIRSRPKQGLVVPKRIVAPSVVRQLRKRGLIALEARHVSIDDVKRLTKWAGFDDAYLDQPRPWAKSDDRPSGGAEIRAINARQRIPRQLCLRT